MKLPLLLLPALCGGCLLGPDFERPDASPYVPDAFRTGPAPDAAPDASPQAPCAPAVSEAQWWAAWNDPLLERLLEQGSSTNLTLLQAEARLRQSRATLDAARASLFPSLGLSGSASRSKTFDPDASRSSYRAGGDAAWEIDLFGRNRRTAEAAEADLEASGLSVDDARLSLRAEIASDYVALRLAQASLEIARSNLVAEVESAEIARAKGESGFSSGADVAASEAAIATARAALPAREAAVSAAARALEQLLALPPFALEEELARLAEFSAGFAVNYLKYISGVTDPTYGYQRLSAYLMPGSDLDNRMKDAMDGLSWAHTSSITVDSSQLNGALALGEGFYLCDISATATTFAMGHGEVETVNNMRVIVLDSNNDVRAIHLKLY